MLLMLAFHALILYMVYNNFYQPFMQTYLSDKREAQIQEEFELIEIEIIPTSSPAQEDSQDSKASNILLHAQLYLADSPEKRASGLMGLEKMPQPAQGMLFAYDGDVNNPFWMKETLMPLDIAFLHENGTILEILSMEPCPPGQEVCPLYSAGTSYRYALEVPAGYFKEKQIFPGAQINILSAE